MAFLDTFKRATKDLGNQVDAVSKIFRSNIKAVTSGEYRRQISQLAPSMVDVTLRKFEKATSSMARPTRVSNIKEPPLVSRVPRTALGFAGLDPESMRENKKAQDIIERKLKIKDPFGMKTLRLSDSELRSRLSPEEYNKVKSYQASNFLNFGGLSGGMNAKGFSTARNKFVSPFDKKPRFEISDLSAVLKSSKIGQALKEGYSRLGEVLGHQDLYKNYPEFSKLRLQFKDMPEGYKGQFDPNTFSIEINRNLPQKDIRSVILHEVQHAIQEVEDFARGGPLTNLSQDAINTYRRLAGEIEARGVQARESMTAFQRKRTPFFEDTLKREGILPSEVITSFTGQKAGDIDLNNPVNKVINALEEAGPVREVQESLYTKERGQRLAKVIGVGEKVPGEKGYFAQLGQLKGELPKAQYESIRGKIGQEDIDNLFDQITQSEKISEWDKLTAKSGLAKVFGEAGGQVPTRGEIKMMTEVFGKKFTDTVLSKRSMLQKMTEAGYQIANVPRSLMSSIDFSAPLRQGIFMVGKPKQFASAFKDMFKQFASEKSFQEVQQQIRSRPTYELMQENNLAIMDLGKGLIDREEAFMSSLTERIPVIGKFVRASERGYSGFLNKLRADVFDDFVKKGEALGIDRASYLKDAANFVNTATGRGNLGAFEKAAPLLNTVFFSPRLMSSRINLLNPYYYVKLDPVVRKEALKSLFVFAGLGATTLSMAKLGGAEVGADPRSADFGKIKIGNTRLDIFGGFQQYIRMAAQVISGKVISSTTGKVITLGEGYKPLTRKDILLRFFESKEAPVASFISGFLEGTTSTGEKFKVPDEIAKRFIPMVIDGFRELYEEQGAKGLALGIPSIFGVGTQTYGGAKPELKAFLKGRGDIKEVLKLPSWELSGNIVYNELKKMSKEEANAVFKQLQAGVDAKEVLTEKERKKIKNMIDEIKEEKAFEMNKATGEERGLKESTVDQRAQAIAEDLKKLDNKQDKIDLLKRYDELGIITDDVFEQLTVILKKK